MALYTQIRWTFTVFVPLLMALHLHQRGTFDSWNWYCVIVSLLVVLLCAFYVQRNKGIWTPDLGTRQFCCGDTAVMPWLNWCIQGAQESALIWWKYKVSHGCWELWFTSANLDVAIRKYRIFSKRSQDTNCSTFPCRLSWFHWNQ